MIVVNAQIVRAREALSNAINFIKERFNKVSKFNRISIAAILSLALVLGVGMAAFPSGNHAANSTSTSATQWKQDPFIGMPPILPAPVKVAKPKPTPTKNNLVPVVSPSTHTAPVNHTLPPTVAPKPIVKVAYYTVRSGDTVSLIAEEYQVSVATIVNANHLANNGGYIAIGERLAIPDGVWKSVAQPNPVPIGPPVSVSGTLSQNGLEALWVEAGGNPNYKLIASAIAMAESGGNQYATDWDSNGSVDRGYWQINSCNGSLSTFDAYANARAAIVMSDDGLNWHPWVAYNTGAYLRYM